MTTDQMLIAGRCDSTIALHDEHRGHIATIWYSGQKQDGGHWWCFEMEEEGPEQGAMHLFLEGQLRVMIDLGRYEMKWVEEIPC